MLLKDAARVKAGDEISARLAKGTVTATVKRGENRSRREWWRGHTVRRFRPDAQQIWCPSLIEAAKPIKIKIKFKGGGQECPPHTTFLYKAFISINIARIV